MSSPSGEEGNAPSSDPDLALTLARATITARAEACINSLINCAESLHNYPDGGTRWARIRDQIGRFNIWASSMGAFAPLHASLDYRLRDLEEMKMLILDHLDSLLDWAIRLITLVKDLETPCEHSDARHEEIDAGLSSLSIDIDWLHRLANIIRRAGTSRQNTKASNFPLKDASGKDATPVLQQLFRYWIMRDFPTISDDLCGRLISTMLLRRRYILYRRSRQTKLVLDTIKPAPKPAHTTRPAPSAVSGATMPEKTPPIEIKAPTLSAPAMSGVPSTRYTTTVDPEVYQRVVSTPSRVSQAHTIALGSSNEDMIPLAPHTALNASEFICPFCCLILPVRTAENRDAWRAHVKKDLDAYVCLFFPCTSHGEATFSTSAEWISHMQQTHFMRWKCVAKTHKPIAFESQDEYITHIKAEHPGKFNEAQLPSLADISRRPLKRIFDKCPLCGEDDIDKGKKLQDHIAHHLQYLSILSLPSPDDTDVAKDTNITSAANSQSGQKMAASRTTLKSTSHLVPSASFSYQDESPSGTGPPVDEEIPDIDEQHQNGLTLQNSDQPVSEAEQRGDKVLASFVLRFEAETRSSKGRSGNYLSKAEGLSILEDNSPEQGAMIKGYQGQPAPLGNLSTSLPTTLSLWDRAYDALRKDGSRFVKDFETMLWKEAQTANPASNEEPPIQPMPPHNVALGHDYQSEFLSISPPQLTDEQKDCIQMFRLTSNDSDTAYEWYKSGVEERVQGTCLWFLQHDNFQQWLKQESGLLFVSADPWCGKSVLAKYLIDQELPPHSGTICHFFFGNRGQDTSCEVLCALLHQLFSQKPVLVQHAMRLFQHKGRSLIYSGDLLRAIFESAISDPQAGSVTVVLDAVDGCAEGDSVDLVTNIGKHFEVSTLSKLKALITTRSYQQIISKLRLLPEKFSHIHIPGEEESEAISQEVSHVIGHRVERLARDKQLSDPVKHRLKDEFLSMPHRTYLLAHLVFVYLEMNLFDGPDSVFARLPRTVHDAYEAILEKSENAPTAKKVLSIILAARRSLTLREMNVAVNINVNTAEKMQLSSIIDLDLDDEEDFKLNLQSLCRPFVSIQHGRICFLHPSARDFLLRTDLSAPTAAVSSGPYWQNSITLRDANTLLAKICVLYLELFNSDTSRLPGEDDRRALLNYSANYWGYHFREAEVAGDASTLAHLASRICESFSKSRLIWSKVYCSSRKRLHSEDFAGLFIPSYFGHSSVVQLLLDKGADVEARDNDERTALSYAAEKGHEAVVRLLLDKGADVEAWDYYYRTTLSYAAEEGHEAVVRLLLDKGADVEAWDYYYRTTLSYAAEEGHEAVVRLLLDKGADVEAWDEFGRTALSHAAEKGHEAVVRLLLDKGADINAKDRQRRAPLSYAAEKGHEAVVRLLLDKGAGINAKDRQRRAPLSYAAEKGHEAVVRLLLDKGANVEAWDNYYRTTLSYAAEEGHEAVVRLLLDKGADVEAWDNFNGTALSHAAEKGHEAVVRLLLDKGADINAKDRQRRAPLSYAAEKGHEAVVRLLLDKGADINAKGINSWTPLLFAAMGGHEAIVDLLKLHGARSD